MVALPVFSASCQKSSFVFFSCSWERTCPLPTSRKYCRGKDARIVQEGMGTVGKSRWSLGVTSTTRNHDGLVGTMQSMKAWYFRTHLNILQLKVQEPPETRPTTRHCRGQKNEHIELPLTLRVCDDGREGNGNCSHRHPPGRSS